MAMMFDGFSLPEMVAFSLESFEGRELELKGIDLQWWATSSLTLSGVNQLWGHQSGCNSAMLYIVWAVARAMALCWACSCWSIR